MWCLLLAVARIIETLIQITDYLVIQQRMLNVL